MDYIIAVTKTRTLYIVEPHRVAGAYRITRVRPPREHAREAPPPEQLLGEVESVRPVTGPVSVDGSVMHFQGKSYVAIPGTRGNPAYQKRMVIGGVECPFELTTPLVFVGSMPETRGWVVPYMIRAWRAGDPAAHFLCFAQEWESSPGPRTKGFYARYREAQAERLRFPGDPMSKGVAHRELAEALAKAAGGSAIEVDETSGLVDVAVRVMRDGGRIAMRVRPLLVEDSCRSDIAEALGQAWNRMQAGFEVMDRGGKTLRFSSKRRPRRRRKATAKAA